VRFQLAIAKEVIFKLE
jgi:hypothetical protein